MADQLRSPLEYAQAYAAIDWAVVPLHWITDAGECSCGNPSCRSQGKHPLTARGVKDASKERGVIERWWSKWPRANIGVATGAISGITVLDVDPRNGGEAPAGMPETAMAMTGGGGEHYVFAHHPNLPAKLGAGLDVKNDGGYIVVEPSRHHSGGSYHWDSMSSPLEGVACANFPTGLLPPSVPATHRTGVRLLPRTGVDTVRSALSFISPDDRDEWIAVGQALKSTQAGDQAFGLWDEWSKRSEKYDPADMRTRWDTLSGDRTGVGSIINRAKANGWVPVERVKPEPVDPAPEVAGRSGPPCVPLELLTVPGVLGEIADWACETAYRPQRVLAVATALTVGATAMARKYSLRGLRTNLYLVGVAPTGAGKDHGRAVLKRLLMAAGLRDRIGGEEVASGPALIARASANPDAVFALDEFGLLMQAIANPRAGKHITDVMSAMMKLHSSANGIFAGIEYADHKIRPRQDIEYPCINIYATSTGGTLWPALDNSHVLSGFLNRMLVMEVDTPNQKRNRMARRIEDMPPEYPAWIKEVAERAPRVGDPNLTGTPGAPFQMEFCAEAVEVIERFEDECESITHELRDTGLDALWVRAHEHARKIAMIVSLSLDTSSLTIGLDATVWACTYVRFWTERLVRMISTKVVVTDFDRARLAVVNKVAESQSPLTSRELQQKCASFGKLHAETRSQVISTLVCEGQLAPIDRKGRSGPPTTAYILRGQGEPIPMSSRQEAS